VKLYNFNLSLQSAAFEPAQSHIQAIQRSAGHKADDQSFFLTSYLAELFNICVHIQ
jgi:hypothetical protein